MFSGLLPDNQAVPSIVHSGSIKVHLHILALDISQTAKIIILTLRLSGYLVLRMREQII